MRWVWLDYLQMWCLRMRLFVNTSNQTSQTRHAAVDTKKRLEQNCLEASHQLKGVSFE
jgi:hypothetical protein